MDAIFVMQFTFTERDIFLSSSPFFATFLRNFSAIFITNVNIFCYSNMIAAVISPNKAEKIAQDILSLNDKKMILSVSIRDWSGNSLAVRSTDAFRQRFRANELVGSKYSGTLAIAALGVVNEIKDFFGEAQAIITIHQDCKLMLLPMPSYRLLIGLVFERLAVIEDYSLANKIERILVEAIES